MVHRSEIFVRRIRLKLSEFEERSNTHSNIYKMREVLLRAHADNDEPVLEVICQLLTKAEKKIILISKEGKTQKIAN